MRLQWEDFSRKHEREELWLLRSVASELKLHLQSIQIMIMIISATWIIQSPYFLSRCTPCSAQHYANPTPQAPVHLNSQAQPATSTSLIFSLIHSSLNFPIKNGWSVSISSMMPRASSPLAARPLNCASCLSVQQAGCFGSVVLGLVAVLADSGLAEAAGLVGSGLGLTMMIGYRYVVFGKWREWIVKLALWRARRWRCCDMAAAEEEEEGKKLKLGIGSVGDM